MKSNFLAGCADCDIFSPSHELRERPETVGEEIANSVSHGVGLLAALVAIPFLVLNAWKDDTARVVGAAIFGVTLVLLYLASTLYHAFPRGRTKHVLRRIEHAVIYLLIAGTYTPFTLGVLRGAWGWTLFGVIWGLAITGVLLKSFGGLRFPVLSMVLYLLMGWVVVIAIRPLWLRMPHAGLFWIVAGGIAYTAGVPFYAAKKRRYAHFIWHLFVLAGTLCHYVAVYRYAD